MSTNDVRSTSEWCSILVKLRRLHWGGWWQRGTQAGGNTRKCTISRAKHDTFFVAVCGISINGIETYWNWVDLLTPLVTIQRLDHQMTRDWGLTDVVYCCEKRMWFLASSTRHAACIRCQSRCAIDEVSSHVLSFQVEMDLRGLQMFRESWYPPSCEMACVLGRNHDRRSSICHVWMRALWNLYDFAVNMSMIAYVFKPMDDLSNYCSWNRKDKMPSAHTRCLTHCLHIVVVVSFSKKRNNII